jgi:glycosyltransferase involved in cell wall biosynthesis
VRSRLPGARDFYSDVKPSSPIDAAHLSIRLAAMPRETLFYSPGYNAPLLSRVPFIFTIHDLNHIDFPGNRTLAKAAYYRGVMKPACRRARAVLTVSAYSRQRICEWSGLEPARVVNVGNGVDPLFTAEGPAWPHQRHYVLCMGNRRPHKNELRTLQAFARIATDIPHDLLFIGDVSPELSSAIRSLGLFGRVQFLGALDDAALASVYRGADALLFVSLHEGFGLPVVEAMACGTPVITSNVCALPEVAGGAASIVDPTLVEAISDALLTVLTEPEVAAAMVAKGLANAGRYSWDRTAATVRQALDACTRS